MTEWGMALALVPVMFGPPRKTCEQCGQSFSPRHTHGAVFAKYCSDECYSTAAVIRAKARRSLRRTGLGK